MADESVQLNLVSNFGFGWRRAQTEWEPRNGVDRHLRLIGKRAGTLPANFWAQEGIYVLRSRGRVHYVGVSKRLGERLDTHTTDRHRKAWDSFDWYGFQPVSLNVDRNGFLELEPRIKEHTLRTWRLRADIEAILGRTYPGPGQVKKPHFGAAGIKEWIQMSPAHVVEYRKSLKAGR